MLNQVTGYIKTQPRLYDWLNAWRRPESPMERWLDAFSRSHAPLRFIQIGASDGLRWDPFRPFIIRDSWQGLFVEPLPNVFPLLQENYAYLSKQGLNFVNAAISSTDGHLTFWSYRKDFLSSLDTEERLGLLRLASFNREHIVKMLPPRLEYTVQYLEAVIVPAMTFSSLLGRHWLYETLDLVTIDAEGHDDTIIRSMDLISVRPRAIVFETHNLSAEARASLYEWLGNRRYCVRQLKGDAVAERQD